MRDGDSHLVIRFQDGCALIAYERAKKTSGLQKLPETQNQNVGIFINRVENGRSSERELSILVHTSPTILLVRKFSVLCKQDLRGDAQRLTTIPKNFVFK